MFGIMALMMAMCMSATFVSCGDDDDDESGSGAAGSNATLTIGSERVSLPYGVYYKDGSSWEIEFTNYDPTDRSGKYPSSLNFMAISIDGAEGNEPPTGTFKNCHIYLVHNASLQSEGKQSEGKADVTIGKSGNAYTVTFSDGVLEVGDETNVKISFTYKGALNKLSEEYQG